MDREKFIENVRKEQEGLRRFLLALCSGDGATADDLAQDALVKAYVASSSYESRCKFSTWLYRIAYNCFIDNVRKSGREEANGKVTMSAAGKDVSASVERVQSESMADGRFEYQALYMAIDRLPANERAAILLFYMDDRPVKEISVILDMPSGTVRSHLSRGREHLKNYIER